MTTKASNNVEEKKKIEEIFLENYMLQDHRFRGEVITRVKPKYDNPNILVEDIQTLLQEQKKEIGEEFNKWLYQAEYEDIEDAIERITGVQVDEEEGGI